MKQYLKKQQVHFVQKLPPWPLALKALPADTPQTFFIICDRKLKPWIRSLPPQGEVYFVKGGESLKDIQFFPRHIHNILKKAGNKKISCFISMGGGSVGDFTGFISSIYHRGIPVLHIPSTWLAAMDSAHGGKTALNAGSAKNVLGSFHKPSGVFIAKNILDRLPDPQTLSSIGELIKISLIVGDSFYSTLIQKMNFLFSSNSLFKNPAPPDLKNILWDFLPQAVFHKLKITEHDFFDKKNKRVCLNFGHTLGHALEAYLQIPHGQAVAYGMIFSILWSHKRFNLSQSFLKELQFLLKERLVLQKQIRKIPKIEMKKLLLKDKKTLGDELNFIFIQKPGRVITERVSVKDIVKEIYLL